MNLPKCPSCKEKYVTAKAKYFFKKEGLTGEPICLYCLADKTGKQIGSTGMLGESKEPIPPIRRETVPNPVRGCRPCAERRRMLR